MLQNSQLENFGKRMGTGIMLREICHDLEQRVFLLQYLKICSLIFELFKGDKLMGLSFAVGQIREI